VTEYSGPTLPVITASGMKITAEGMLKTRMTIKTKSDAIMMVPYNG
jgi:hypothetical protein